MTKTGSGYRLDQKTYIDTQIKWWVSNNNLEENFNRNYAI
jgi:hypothetical protein